MDAPPALERDPSLSPPRLPLKSLAFPDHKAVLPRLMEVQKTETKASREKTIEERRAFSEAKAAERETNTLSFKKFLKQLGAGKRVELYANRSTLGSWVTLLKCNPKTFHYQQDDGAKVSHKYETCRLHDDLVYVPSVDPNPTGGPTAESRELTEIKAQAEELRRHIQEEEKLIKKQKEKKKKKKQEDEDDKQGQQILEMCGMTRAQAKFMLTKPVPVPTVPSYFPMPLPVQKPLPIPRREPIIYSVPKPFNVQPVLPLPDARGTISSRQPVLGYDPLAILGQ